MTGLFQHSNSTRVDKGSRWRSRTFHRMFFSLAAVLSAGFPAATAFAQATPALWIDSPTEGQIISGSFSASGWALGNYGTPTVQVSIDGGPATVANYGDSRPDVCEQYPGSPGCDNNYGVGWDYTLPNLSAGPHTLTVTATDSYSSTLSRSFVVDQGMTLSGSGAWASGTANMIYTTTLRTSVDVRYLQFINGSFYGNVGNCSFSFWPSRPSRWTTGCRTPGRMKPGGPLSRHHLR